MRRSLAAFVHEAWPVLEPGTDFVSNWHIDAICEHLEAITRGELTRVIINIPPRHMMKSLAVTVFWPCWEWLSRPETRFLFASYAQNLSTRDSLKCRRLIQLPGFEDSRVAESERTLIERIGYLGVVRVREGSSAVMQRLHELDLTGHLWRRVPHTQAGVEGDRPHRPVPWRECVDECSGLRGSSDPLAPSPDRRQGESLGRVDVDLGAGDRPAIDSPQREDGVPDRRGARSLGDEAVGEVLDGVAGYA